MGASFEYLHLLHLVYPKVRKPARGHRGKEIAATGKEIEHSDKKELEKITEKERLSGVGSGKSGSWRECGEPEH